MARQDQHSGAAKSHGADGQVRESPIAVQKALKGIHYPARKDDLLRQAQQNHASQEVIGRIRSMHADRYEKPTDVMKALGKSE
jgi:hypothetical protein